MTTAHEAFEEIGQLSDELDNALAALSLPIDKQIHIDGMSHVMRNVRNELRRIVRTQIEYDPWEFEPK
jgi:hypothetical protein